MSRNREYIPYIRKMIGHREVRATGVSALVVNEKDEILLEKRRDNGKYSLPGGCLDRDETIREGVLREIKEETGLSLKGGNLFRIISPNKNKVTYPNGDVTAYTNIVFLFKVDSKECLLNRPHDEESTRIAFLPFDRLPGKEEFLVGSYEPIIKYKKKDFTIVVD